MVVQLACFHPVASLGAPQHWTKRLKLSATKALQDLPERFNTPSKLNSTTHERSFMGSYCFTKSTKTFHPTKRSHTSLFWTIARSFWVALTRNALTALGADASSSNIRDEVDRLKK
ncbi:hypothetical protein GOP47_0000659 [Adiantum capillus-veneris]|uniref:Uncharacterized protein n=1 Tax=Adiantum capillus-veneris TaxID=13818 RepID=A0A9D4ZTA1_ADICA|nr:hypothetical protein GOP47_0000659 [Adiantum capillus-veneris]